MTNEEIIEKLSDMSVVELIALTKRLENEWGVKAQPAVVQSTVVEVETKPVQTEFDLVLMSVAADKKIALIKVVREMIGLGLKESKDLVEAAPKKIKESISKSDADALAAKLIEAGATVEIK